MRTLPPAARDYFLARYTVSLVQGETIDGTLIKHSTIRKYLAAAHDLFEDLDITSDNNFADTILKAVKRYEDEPKRCRMITDGMMQWLIDQSQTAGPDSETHAINDWIILGRYTGFRAAEWSQTTLNSYTRIDDCPGQPARAVTRNDFSFLGANERRLTDRELDDRHILYLAVKWRLQKNGNNGQEITFAGDPTSPNYSATRAGHRIYQRSIRLGMSPDEPMAVFKDKRGKVKFITDNLVNSLLRHAASAVLGIPRGHKDLNLWSTHSI